MSSDRIAPVDWRVIEPRDVLDLVQHELPLDESEARYVAASRAPSTLRGYRHDWIEWCDWSANRGHAPLPARPDVLAAWSAAIADAGAKAGTIRRKLSAVRYAHKVAGLDDPTATARVSMVWDGIRRSIAREDSARSRVDQAPPLMPPMLWDVVDACPTSTAWTTRDNQPSLAGARDRALLLVGFFGALRRSELARLRVEDLHDDARGLVVELPWSKTNQYGDKHDLVALPRTSNPAYCPVTAMAQWRELAGITEGPLLRRVTKGNRAGAGLSESGVNLVVQEAVRRSGRPTTGVPVDVDAPATPATRQRVPYSAHSLRAGFVTYAHSRGATPSQIAHQTRHASLASVRGYTRIASVWDDNAVTALGV